MKQRYTKYATEELIAFINRAKNLEMLRQADEFIAKLHMPDDMREEVEAELIASFDMMHDPSWGCYSGYEEDYGPSNPWDAPGMRVSDFIRI